VSTAGAAATDAPARIAARPGAWLAGAIVVFWLPVIARWSPAWSALPEQAFGWIVPWLALALAWERAKDAPVSVGIRPSGSSVSPGRAWVATSWLPLFLLIAVLAALPPALAVLEANPLWPLAQWTAVALAMTATLAVLASAGGTVAARRFAFPVLFVGTALLWPTWVTVRLVGALVTLNAQLAAAVVSVLGRPAVVQGNVIELAAGYVGVDEACSGLRSLQAVWMAGWFFGELFRLRWPRRIALVVAALAVATAVNWLRTTALTWIAAAHGLPASERWHDRLGAIELVATLAAVLLIAWRLAHPAGAAGEDAAPAPSDIPVSDTPARGTAFSRPAGRAVAALLLAGAALAALAPEAWYRWHEHRAASERIRWTLARPDETWRSVEVPRRAHELLQATSLTGWTRDEPGGRALAYLVTWEDDVARAAAAEAHDPTICLPASGVQPEIAAAPVTVDIAGVPVAFTEAAFTAEGRGQRVFYCHWDAWLGRARAAAPADMTDVPAWRLARVREGRRRGDAAYLALVVPLADEAGARAWLRRWAPRLYECR